MRIADYMLLSIEERADMLWDQGLHLDSEYGTYETTTIYYLRGNYIKLITDNVKNQIVDIKPVSKEAWLRKPSTVTVWV